MTGVHPCTCRDCMELTYGDSDSMCHDCEDADCEPGAECQAER